MLKDNYLHKAKVLFVSVLIAVAVNAGIVALLNSIVLTKPQNPAPLFSLTTAHLTDNIISPRVRPAMTDHSRLSIISSYTVNFHTTFDPFPTPPNPGKLKRPLDHEHLEGSSCMICRLPWISGIGL